jgi:hypothetical protein
MDENTTIPPPSPTSRHQFSLSSLFTLTFVVACVLAAARCQGPKYGPVTVVPLGIIAVLALYTQWRCLVGTVIGAVIVGVYGFFGLVLPHGRDPGYSNAMFLVEACGGAIGASIDAIILKRWVVGAVMLAASVTIFVIVLCKAVSPLLFPQ